RARDRGQRTGTGRAPEGHAPAIEKLAGRHRRHPGCDLRLRPGPGHRLFPAGHLPLARLPAEDRYVASAFFSRATPSASFSSDAAKHQRTKPSPCGPNADPGARPSPASRTSFLQNARLSSTPLTRIKAYIVPSGIATSSFSSFFNSETRKFLALR